MEQPGRLQLAARHGDIYLRQQLAMYTSWNVAKPTVVWATITCLCQAKCKQCSYWQMKRQPELTTDEWYKVVRDLGKWVPGVKFNIAGGEPTLRKDLLDIVKVAAEAGCLPGYVTNAFLLTQAYAEKTVLAGAFNVNISLDGIGPMHDDLRGTPGAFEKVDKAIDYLQAARAKHGSNLKDHPEVHHDGLQSGRYGAVCRLRQREGRGRSGVPAARRRHGPRLAPQGLVRHKRAVEARLGAAGRDGRDAAGEEAQRLAHHERRVRTCAPSQASWTTRRASPPRRARATWAFRRLPSAGPVASSCARIWTSPAT